MTPRVELHPASIKHIKKGHPWITSDRFSDKFPKNSFFVACRLDDVNFVVMINDPTHPTVKARVWKIDPKSSIEKKDFTYEMVGRLNQSLEIREAQDFERDNYYLVFGEADFLPGLFIQKLGSEILVQFYADFWHNFEKDIIKSLQRKYQKNNIWVQKRNKSQEKEFYCATNKGLKEHSFTLREFGVEYSIELNKFYDTGIYTDMSAIRAKLIPEFDEKNVLNLYCYTGAYSLCAMKHGAKSVTSVDLSAKYLDWLDKNISLNQDLEAIKDKHTRIEAPTLKALDTLIKEGKTFDLIICDPPSASSDGKKKTSAIDSYKEIVPKLSKLLNKGGKAVVFLNTHSITRRSFEEKIKNYIGTEKLAITGALKLTGDCPSLKGFVEGDYLKGLTLLKK
ncbi:class I SAM-dependent rRNA methyltransferase [Bacteriovorax sp. Seq25_V]|uniref:class I SAM-dependent rRNA methyltransferase n=1 Tax=Bacteriovorax sp. Seq25_V TaxID=1201288 RepID=UPI000389FA78|nr:class I SAM-dependent methyltransferase [Bacteriovorax sp. Seq25_V]EQC46590.1 putative ribosomal RNA large subunit methyltransferase J [Bacteriovorax sp. Seq25_V]